ncbi:MAG: hypothetical protein OXU23_12610 [Candidatus Poribacteria bacterium]|nr:hypothetical protein [Candidatus Poribacteria bacterium]
MKRPIFQVHGPPEKRRYFYGTLLIILGSFDHRDTSRMRRVL